MTWWHSRHCALEDDLLEGFFLSPFSALVLSGDLLLFLLSLDFFCDGDFSSVSLDSLDSLDSLGSFLEADDETFFSAFSSLLLAPSLEEDFDEAEDLVLEDDEELSLDLDDLSFPSSLSLVSFLEEDDDEVLGLEEEEEPFFLSPSATVDDDFLSSSP